MIAHAGCGGGSEGNDRKVWEAMFYQSETCVCGAKVVAPLRNAMRFVDGGNAQTTDFI